MFFSDPAIDLQVIIYSSLVAAAIALGVYFFTKKILLATFVFSVLENFIFYGNSGSRLFDVYNAKWVVIFALDYWPYINIGLFVFVVINFIKNKNVKTK